MRARLAIKRDLGREMYRKQHAINRGPLGLSHLFSHECESEIAAGGALLGLGDILAPEAGQKLTLSFSAVLPLTLACEIMTPVQRPQGFSKVEF